MRITALLVALMVSGLAAAPAAGQAHPSALVLEVSGAHALFLDDDPIAHAALGGSIRWYVTSRVSVGPEITYMIGPGTDRDLLVTGNFTVDFRDPRGPARLVPYVLVGAGLFRHSERFGGQTFTSQEPGATVGVGVRFRVTPHLSIAPEVRLGWEPHMRIGATVAYRFGQ
jgi:Outer membrane protein beta-barrel domain